MSANNDDFSTARYLPPSEDPQNSASSTQKVNQLINEQAGGTATQTTRSLADKLPPEILLQIFCLIMWQEPCHPCPPANPSQLHDYHKQPLALSQICSYWRVITLGTSSLWSHVHLTLGAMKDSMKSRDLAQLFLRRTQDAPLSIWVDGQKNISDSGMSMIVECLQPYFRRVESFNLFNQSHPRRVRRLVSAWMAHGQAGSVRTLIIWLHDDLTKVIDLRRGVMSQQLWDLLAESIRVLRLRGGFSHRLKLVSHNLVVLQLESAGTTAPSLLQTLSACPWLQILKLREIMIYSSPNEAANLALTQLKHLQIQRVFGLSCLLTKLSVPSQRLSLSIDLYGGRESSLAVRAFLERCQVKQLRIFNTGPKFRINEYLSSCRDFDTLILRCNALDSYGHSPPAGRTPALWPKTYTGPHELHIMNGSIGNKRVADVLETYLRSTLASSASSFAPSMDPCVFELFGDLGDDFVQLEPFIKHASSTQLGRMDPDFPDHDSNVYP